MFVTNQPTIVKYAKECYSNFPTIVNALQESGITYQNTKTAYAQMDNKFAKSQLGIGWSSNLAQLALTYYWTELHKDHPDPDRIQELYDNFIILSVLAQVIIDGCKREYEIDGMEEIKRIQSLSCMNMFEDDTRKDFPAFMKYTREVPVTKQRKERPYEDIKRDRDKLKSRINTSLYCPMNWMEECLDRLPNNTTAATIPTKEFFIKMAGRGHDRQMTKIRQLIQSYDDYLDQIASLADTDKEMYTELVVDKTDEIVAALQTMKIGNIVTINRLVEIALGIADWHGVSAEKKKIASKHPRKMLNLLYRMNKSKFFLNFTC